MIRSHLANLFSTNSISMFIKQFDKLMVETLSGWEHGISVVIHDEALKVFDKNEKKRHLKYINVYFG